MIILQTFTTHRPGPARLAAEALASRLTSQNKTNNFNTILFDISCQIIKSYFLSILYFNLFLR